ncbi:MAG: hypothetical protein AAGI54_04120 [Planctomycetota bacterium]
MVKVAELIHHHYAIDWLHDASLAMINAHHAMAVRRSALRVGELASAIGAVFNEQSGKDLERRLAAAIAVREDA